MFATTANNGRSAMLPLFIISPILAPSIHIGTLCLIYPYYSIDSNSIELNFLPVNARMFIIFWDKFRIGK